MKHEWRNCFKCNYESVTQMLHCPRCRKMRLRTAGEIRALGFLLTILGTVALVMISAATVVYAGIAFVPEKPGSSVKFTGTETDIAVAFGFLAVFLTIGFLSTLAGIWQMIFGRRNRVLLWLTVTLGLTILITGEFILALSQRL